MLHSVINNAVESCYADQKPQSDLDGEFAENSMSDCSRSQNQTLTTQKIIPASNVQKCSGNL